MPHLVRQRRGPPVVGMVWSMASAKIVHEMRMCLVLSPLAAPQKGQSSGIEGTCMRAEVHQPFRKVLSASNLETFFVRGDHDRVAEDFGPSFGHDVADRKGGSSADKGSCDGGLQTFRGGGVCSAGHALASRSGCKACRCKVLGARQDAFRCTSKEGSCGIRIPERWPRLFR